MQYNHYNIFQGSIMETVFNVILIETCNNTFTKIIKM